MPPSFPSDGIKYLPFGSPVGEPSVGFYADLGNRQVLCVVDAPSMVDLFGAASWAERPMLAAFEGNRDRIMAVAAGKIAAGLMDERGRVVIGAADFIGS
jgi:hypothetical protein